MPKRVYYGKEAEARQSHLLYSMLKRILDLLEEEDSSYYEDGSAPDYEKLTEFQTQGPILPNDLGDSDDDSDLSEWVI